MPGSPDTNTTQPSPFLVSAQRRSSSSISSSRPTSGVVVPCSASNRPSAAPSRSACQARDVLGEALERESAEIAVFEQAARQPMRTRSDHYRAGLGDRLQAGRESASPRPPPVPGPSPRREDRRPLRDRSLSLCGPVMAHRRRSSTSAAPRQVRDPSEPLARRHAHWRGDSRNTRVRRRPCIWRRSRRCVRSLPRSNGDTCQ